MAFDPFRGYVADDPASIADVQRRRKLADQLLSNKVQNGSQLGVIADILAGTASGWENKQAADEETQGRKGATDLLAQALSGSADPAMIAQASGSGFLDDTQSALLRGAYDTQNDLKLAQVKKDMGLDGADPSSVREWQYFSKLPPEQQSQYLIMKRSVPYLNTGDGFIQPNPVNSGQPNGPSIPIDNYGPAFDKAKGGAEGAATGNVQAEADSLESKLPGLQTVMDQLGDLAQKATYTQTGQLWDTIVRETGQMPSEGALARTEYMAVVDNQVLPLLRDTFGAAFTAKEGESLRATLGAPDKSPAEKKAVLQSFIAQKVRDLQAMKSRLGTDGGAAPVTPVGTSDPAVSAAEALLSKYP